MTRMTGLSLNRRFEKSNDRFGEPARREKKIEIPRSTYELDCGRIKFNILLSSGQMINKKKMCKKLLAKLKEENYGKEKRKGGYQG